MDVGKRILIALTAVGALLLSGCGFLAGAAAGAAGGYEYQNKEKMDQLDEDLAEGRISQEEYDRRKKEIEKESVAY